MTSISTKFNFDEWARLARESPDAFETMRLKMIRDAIENTSPEVKRRLEGLQWKIDQTRSTSKNPMSSCLKISQMMWDNVAGENGLLDHMRQLNEPEQLSRSSKPEESATIIDIKYTNPDPKKS